MNNRTGRSVDHSGDASITESVIGDIPWIVAEGDREATLHALGRHSADRIASVLDSLPDLARLRHRATRSSRVATQVDAVLVASREQHPSAWRELSALAAGAGVARDDLALLSVRGDLGPPGARECSDLGWTDGVRAVLGHNEDGDRALDGRCALLTLRIAGEPAIVTWWYPGFLPGNTFTINESGLVWGVDSISVQSPPPLPGRSFVARGLQQAGTLEQATSYLERHPAAGGFAYVIGQLGSPRLATIEHAARFCAVSEIASGPAAVWHTNHLRHTATALDRPSADSLRRGATLAAAPPPPTPSVEAVRRLLLSPPPQGVRAAGATRTLCTLMVDLASRRLTMVPSTGAEAAVDIDTLLTSNDAGGLQSPLGAAG